MEGFLKQVSSEVWFEGWKGRILSQTRWKQVPDSGGLVAERAIAEGFELYPLSISVLSVLLLSAQFCRSSSSIIVATINKLIVLLLYGDLLERKKKSSTCTVVVYWEQTSTQRCPAFWLLLLPWGHSSLWWFGRNACWWYWVLHGIKVSRIVVMVVEVLVLLSGWTTAPSHCWLCTAWRLTSAVFLRCWRWPV